MNGKLQVVRRVRKYAEIITGNVGFRCLPESSRDGGGHGVILSSNSSSLVAEMRRRSRGNDAGHRGLYGCGGEPFRQDINKASNGVVNAPGEIVGVI
jgi:hypothetical protein